VFLFPPAAAGLSHMDTKAKLCCNLLVTSIGPMRLGPIAGM